MGARKVRTEYLLESLKGTYHLEGQWEHNIKTDVKEIGR
jgi:hypothetical protein